jgi:hypothetical protein
MPRKIIRQQLGELNREAERRSIEGDKRAELESLVEVIEQQVDPERPSVEAESLAARVENAISELEAEYPTVTAILGDILNKLAAAGL